MTEIETYTLNHPWLGNIRGQRRGNDVVQFRGIPYADIPARFRQAVLRTSLPRQNDEVFDALLPGRICPQSDSMPFPPLWEEDLIDTELIPQPKPVADEFCCLNLNVTAPYDVLEQGETCPVMIFIHGGAFVTGSSAVQVGGREIYDPTELVKASDRLGKPLVVVTINYRLGPLGFLASKQLRQFNESHGEAVGNYGLHDQRTAIEWVWQYIAAFGGDPENITLQGASAGGASCHFQAVFEGTRVKRAILASGTALAIGAMPLEYHQEGYDALTTELCTDGRGEVEDLQGIPVETLIKQVSGVSKPLIDGQWIRGRGARWLQETPTKVDLLIGSCDYEQDVTKAILGGFDPTPPKNPVLSQQIHKSLVPSGLTSKTDDYFPSDLLSLYSLAYPADDASSIHEWAVYLADIIFRVPPYLIAEVLSTQHPSESSATSTTGKIYLYDFKAKSPYPKWRPGYQKAHHAVTDIFLFNVAPDMVPDEHSMVWRLAVEQLQNAWIKFCWGALHWDAIGRDNVRIPVYVLEDGYVWERKIGIDSVTDPEGAKRWKALLTISER